MPHTLHALAGCLLLASGLAAQSTLLSEKFPERSVARYEVTPDGRRVVYKDRRLYSVDVQGLTAPVRLDERLSVGDGLALSPDGRWAVHLAFVGGPALTEIASVPLAGGAPPIDLGLTGAFLITGDSRRVVVRLDDLVSVPIDGSEAPLLLQGGLRPIEACVLAPDGERVVYVAEAFGLPGGGALFVRPADGSRPALALNPVGPIATARDDRLVLSADSRHLVFRAGQPLTRGRLAAVPLDASTGAVVLDATNTDWLPDGAPRIAADGTVVYKHDGSSPILSVPVAGGVAPLSLTEVLEPGSSGQFELTRDSARVVFVHGTGAGTQLFVAPTDGSAPPRALTGMSGSTQDAAWFELDPAGERVVFLGRPLSGGPLSFWSMPLDGSQAPLRLTHQPLTPGGGWPGRLEQDGFGLAQDGAVLVYAVARLEDTVLERCLFQLFAVPTDGSAPPVRLDGPTIRSGGVRFLSFRPDGTSGGVLFRIAARGKRVVYVADQREDGLYELFSAPLPAPVASPSPRRSR